MRPASSSRCELYSTATMPRWYAQEACLPYHYGDTAVVPLFVDMSMQVMGLLLGAVIIATMGALDDILNLNPWIKFAGQILAALVAIRCGILFDVISNPGFLSGAETISIGWLSYPVTILWIVACTNAVNLIDGLDGLAVGVSAISSLSMMVEILLAPTTYLWMGRRFSCLHL